VSKAKRVAAALQATVNPNQALVTAWVVQLIGTMVLAGIVLVFFKSSGTVLKDVDPKWALYALYAATAAIIPPILYLRNYKKVLDLDRLGVAARGGTPDPEVRTFLMRALRVGGALCELPQAFGVVHILLGGETRWFLGATLVTIALRLSYRPFERLR
jgi:hypothetical protein